MTYRRIREMRPYHRIHNDLRFRGIEANDRYIPEDNVKDFTRVQIFTSPPSFPTHVTTSGIKRTSPNSYSFHGAEVGVLAPYQFPGPLSLAELELKFPELFARMIRESRRYLNYQHSN